MLDKKIQCQNLLSAIQEINELPILIKQIDYVNKIMQKLVIVYNCLITELRDEEEKREPKIEDNAKPKIENGGTS
jgi:hypothetical protein